MFAPKVVDQEAMLFGNKVAIAAMSSPGQLPTNHLEQLFHSLRLCQAIDLRFELMTGIGLLPLAIGGNQPGYEIEYPMAIVILGGLMSSTLLNLLVVPLVYARFGYVAKEEATA
jgi:AcrB/AcrD/AcrF family